MKNLKVLSILILFVASSLSVFAQDKYFTREGFISFNSETDIETIHADNYKVTSVLDSETGKMEFAVLMKAFEFEKALMEEHFNENYVESSKFPKATFKGNILEVDAINWLTDGEYKVKVKGSLTVHGVSKDIVEDGSIKIENGSITAISSFSIAITDYDIVIPKVVVKNISETVKVDIKMNYKKLSKS